jgi:hypothetical protein
VRRLPLLAGLALVAACGKPAPRPTEGQRYQAIADATSHLVGSVNPCVIRVDNDHVLMRPMRNCLDLMPQERFQGVWYTGFEESGFVPNATTAPAVRLLNRETAREPMVMLDMPREVSDRLWTAMPHAMRGTMAVRIAFFGRREKQPRFGEQIIIVDRVERMRILGRVRTLVDLPGIARGIID